MKPILFNTDMVCAILDGRKTVTRRAVKDKDITNAWDCDSDGTPIAYIEQKTGDSYLPTYPCPYQPCDILYVRETWRIVDYLDGLSLKFEYAADGKISDFIDLANDRLKKFLKYTSRKKWCPNIFMPREAARIFLRVANVRVERLQAISNQDIVREGVKPWWLLGCRCAWYRDGCLDEPCGNRDAYQYMCHHQPFMELWNSTINPADRDRYGWDANPWVWVIEFERISKEEAERARSHDLHRIS